MTISMMLLGTLSLAGTGNQEAVQVSLGAGYGSYCIMYMLLFAVALLGFRSGAIQTGLGLKIAAFAAFLVSLCGLVFEIVPLGEVASPALFAMKVGGVILATNALGGYLYWRAAS